MPRAAIRPVDALIVGAGMAGLAAASELRRAGREVLVLDKGRGVGGRVANRRIGSAVFDHGAQHFTARSDAFVAAVEGWERGGVVRPWHRAAAESSARPRWRGEPTMSAVAAHLAAGVAVRSGTQVTAVRQTAAGWAVSLDGGETVDAAALVLTPPVPQSLALLDAGGVTLASDDRAALSAITYDRCLAVLAVLGHRSRVPSPGGVALQDGPIAWLADNQAKGVSPVPAITIHATPAFSEAHWDDDPHGTARALLAAAAPWLGTAVRTVQLHRWRYSRPRQTHAESCLLAAGGPPLCVAGDAFGGPRVEGAVVSGWAAAAALLDQSGSALPTEQSITRPAAPSAAGGP